MTEQEKNIKTNPFSSKMSGYGFSEKGVLKSVYPKGSPMHDFHTKAYEYLKTLIGGESFACVAGQTAVRAESYILAAYPSMTDPQVAEGLCHDLMEFTREYGIPDKEKGPKGQFRSFVATFEGPMPTSQMQAAEYLYTLLKNIHSVDKKYFPWAKGISADLESTDFGFSIGEAGYFIPSFHPFTSSEVRRSDMLFVVFNAHAMFDTLRKQGKFDKLKQIIRRRQAHVHPYLGDHGTVNEWVQYALVDSDEKSQQEEKALRRKVLGECPFGHK